MFNTGFSTKKVSDSKVNYYQVLGVKINATPKQIKEAYKKLALKYHSDKLSGAGAGDDIKDISMKMFELVNEARVVLSDPVKRAEHNDNIKKGISKYDSAASYITVSDFTDFENKFNKFKSTQDMLSKQKAQQKAQSDFDKQDTNSKSSFNKQDTKSKSSFNKQDTKSKSDFNKQDTKSKSSFNKQDTKSKYKSDFNKQKADSEDNIVDSFVFKSSDDFTKNYVEKPIKKSGFMIKQKIYDSFGTKVINSLDKSSYNTQIAKMFNAKESAHLYVNKMLKADIEKLEGKSLSIHCKKYDSLFKDSEISVSVNPNDPKTMQEVFGAYDNCSGGFCPNLDNLLPTEALLMYQCIEG